MAALRQSGGKYKRDMRTGLRKLDLVYNIDTLAELDNFTIPQSDNPLGLLEVDRDASELAEGDWQLIVSLEGAPTGGGATFGPGGLGESWEINFASEVKPLQCFPRWKAFKEFYKGTTDQKNGQISFPELLKIKETLYKNPAFGVESYLSPKVVLTLEYNAHKLDESIWRNIGKIDNPPQPSRFKIPKPGQGRTWLKYSAVPIDRGSIVGHRIVWWLSDEGGWLPAIYAPHE